MMTLALVVAATLPVPGRSVAASQHGVAASSQPLAAQAAVQILQRGGNAVDAAIAANSTQGVMEPTSNGIGGALFAIVYLAKRSPPMPFEVGSITPWVELAAMAASTAF